MALQNKLRVIIDSIFACFADYCQSYNLTHVPERQQQPHVHVLGVDVLYVGTAVPTEHLPPEANLTQYTNGNELKQLSTSAPRSKPNINSTIMVINENNYSTSIAHLPQEANINSTDVLYIVCFLAQIQLYLQNIYSCTYRTSGARSKPDINRTTNGNLYKLIRFTMYTYW